MLFSTRDALAVDQLLREAARVEILPRFRNLSAHEIRQKSSPTDLVTDADEAAERMIGEGLRRAFPHAVLVGEEATERDPSLLGRLADAELAFLIDPVDGTKNFASGLPLFGVMVAAVMRGEVVAGMIHDPMGDDTAIAVRGEGAWIERQGGERIFASHRRFLSRACQAAHPGTKCRSRCDPPLPRTWRAPASPRAIAALRTNTG